MSRHKIRTFYVIPVLSQWRRCDRQTDRQISQNDAFCRWNIFDDMCRIWPVIVLVSVWRESVQFSRWYVRKTIFYIFVPSNLDVWSFDLIFAPPVTRVQGHVSTKCQVSSFRFSVNHTYGTDRRNKAIQESCAIAKMTARCALYK